MMAASREVSCVVPQSAKNLRKSAGFARNVRSNNVNGFDLRKWRNSQYKKNLGNVEEGQGFADKRKREVARQYAKQTRRDRQQMAAQGIADGGQRPQSMTPNPPPPNLRSESLTTSNRRRFDQSAVKTDSFQKARLEHKERMDAKEKKLQEIRKSREERDAALNKYKKKKVERRKKLLKYTKKGQPVMKGRIELLLETLQRKMTSDAVK